MKRKVKSMSKRTLAMLLTFVLLLTAVPIVGLTAFASGEEDFECRVNESTKECIVFNYLGNEKDVVIPEKINGNTVMQVVFIGDFSTEPLSSISIPKTVRAIGIGEGSVSVEKFIVDPDNEYFKSVDGVIYSKNGKELVLYPNLKKDAEYSIPEGVTKIKNDEHESKAFTNCEYIKTLNIPASVTNLPDSKDFANLEKVNVAPENANFCSVDGVVFSKDKTQLIMYPARLQKGLYEIPEGTVNVVIGACYTTEVLVVPTSVKSLAVGNCPEPCFINVFFYKGSENEWTKIEQPPTATHEAKKYNWDGKGYWDYYVNEDGTAELSYYVGNEEEIIIPEEINGHKVVAFYGAFTKSNVKKVTVPDCLKDLSGEKFEGYVEEIVVYPTNPNYKTVDGIIFNKEMTELVVYPSHKPSESYTVPNTVKKLGYCAFYMNENLETVTLPAGLGEIGYSAFNNSRNIEEIKIPANAVIGTAAFAGSGVKRVVLEDGRKTINAQAFLGSYYLEEIVIPASVKKVEEYAFSDIGHLAPIEVYYGGSRSDWKAIEIDNVNNGNDALLNANIHYNSEEASTTEPTTEITTAPVETTTEPTTETTTEATTAPTETTTETTTEVTTTKPADTTKPTEVPTKPTEAPTKPTEAPTKPTEAPTKPTEAPTKPTEAPTKPTEAPTKPTEAPTKPTEAPTKPTEAPTKPTEAPTKPTEAPTKPTEAPTAPVITTKPTDTTAPADETTAPVNTTKQDETTAAVIPGTTVSDTAAEESTTEKESIVDTGDTTMILAAFLPMVAAAAAVIVVSKKKKEEK